MDIGSVSTYKLVHSVQLESVNVKPKKGKHWLNIWAAQSVLGWHVSFYFLKMACPAKDKIELERMDIGRQDKTAIGKRRPSPPLVGCQLIPTGPANVWPILLAKGNWQIPAGQAK